MSIQIIITLLAGILIGIVITLVVSRYYVQKVMKQLTENGGVAPATATKQKAKGNAHPTFIKLALALGAVVVILSLLVPLGAEAGVTDPAPAANTVESEAPHFLFSYPGGWLFNGSDSNIYFTAGNVGINTITPTEKLHVEGNIKLNGDITSDGDICIGSCGQ